MFLASLIKDININLHMCTKFSCNKSITEGAQADGQMDIQSDMQG